MGHFKTGATRAEATPVEWLGVGKQIGDLANLYAGRSDIIAYVGPGAGGPAPACFIPNTAEVEVNVDVAFGYGVKPSDINLETRSGRYEFPQAVGAIFHEACHARYSLWDIPTAHGLLAQDEFDALMLLEEGRIEAFGLKGSPRMRTFLESCAMGIVVADASETFAEKGDTHAAAFLTALIWGRVDAGILRLHDVIEVTDLIDDYLGLSVITALRDIATKAREHWAHDDATLLYPLAKEWAALVREVAEEKGEGSPGEQGTGTGAGMGEDGEGEGEGEGSGDSLKDALLDALSDAADNVAIGNASDLDDAESKEKQEDTVRERADRGKEVKKAKDAAAKTFGKGTAAFFGTSTSTLLLTREPLPEERVAANIIATKLEKAKYRDRDVTEVNRVIPPGRLRSRAAVQGAAMRDRGMLQQSEAWRAKVRKQTDEPTLSIGVLVDISGSMGDAMLPMATTAYVLSEASARVQGRAGIVYFGNDVFPVLSPGERQQQVKVYSAPDGTEKFDDAFRAIDGSLNLLHGGGARLLVVVSDGHYTDEETSRCMHWMTRCKEMGVAVVWIPFDMGHTAKSFANVANGEILTGKITPTDAATKIGEACERAINAVTSRRA
jgi:hypothetical protein